MLKRILFAHRAANLGGSQNSTYTRMKALLPLGIESESLFYKSGAGIATFSDFPSYVTSSAERQAAIIERGEYDLVSVINVAPFIKVLHKAGYPGKTMLEIRGRAYLALGQCPELTANDLDAILVPSHYVRSLVEKVLVDNTIPIYVLPNGVDTNLFSPLRRSSAPIRKFARPNRPIVLWVGRLTSVKNWAELLRIARLATDELPRIEFWIAGDSRVSSETDAFISLQRSLGLSNVRLFGCIPYRHMPELYALTRERQGCILSTSLSEGLQNSLLEGMASGLPVVSAAIGGNLELIEHGKNGLLYPSGNPIAGAEQVIKLLSNPDLWRQLAQDGRRAVITDYSMAKHAEAFIRVAAHLVEGGN